MRRSIAKWALLVLFSPLLFASCTVVTPEQGQEAVLIDRPILFGHGGIRPESIKPGRSYTWFSVRKVYVNVYPQQFEANFTDLMSSDGVPLDFHAVIRMQVTDPVALIRDFGEDWYRQNVEQQFYNRVRNAVKKHGMNETAINTTAIDEIDAEVTGDLNKYLAETKIPARLLNVTVGKANPPDAIKTQRVETAAQQQRVLTEGQRKLAEDGRKSAEESRAAADNSYREAMHLSPSQFVEIERIKMLKEVCGAKDSHCTFLIGSEVTPVFNTNGAARSGAQ